MYFAVKTALENVPELAPVETEDGIIARVLPVSELVSELMGPFCILTSRGEEDTYALNGDLMWTDETFEMGFEAEHLLDAIDIAAAARQELEALSQTITPDGRWIASAKCERLDSDAYDVATKLMRRGMRCTIRWYRDEVS